MGFKKFLAAFAALSIGLSACAPGGSKSSTPQSPGNSNVVVSVKSSGAPVDPATVAAVKLFHITLSDGTNTVTVFDDAAGMLIDLATLRSDFGSVISVANVADGTYTSMAVTIGRDAATQKSLHFAVNITVAAGAITNISVAMDPAKTHAIALNHAAHSDAMSADAAPMTSNHPMHVEGTIQTIAADGSSLTFQPEHSSASMTVNIVSNSSDPANDTQIVSGQDRAKTAITVADLAAGDEIVVAGVIDAATNTIVATMIVKEAEDEHHRVVMNPDAVKVLGTVGGVAADGASIEVTVDFARGALPVDTVSVTANISATTKLVKACQMATAADLKVGDKVFVRGNVVRDANHNNAATPVVDASLIVVRPERSAMSHRVEIRGTVSQVDTTAKTFTLTPGMRDMKGNLLLAVTFTVNYADAVLIPADVVLSDQRVEVEGSFDGVNNVLKATKIEVMPAMSTGGSSGTGGSGIGTGTGSAPGSTPTVNTVSLMGDVSNVDANATTFELAVNAFGMGLNAGVKYTVNFGSARLMGFNGATISAGQKVAVTGTIDAAGVLVANVIGLVPGGGMATGGTTTGGTATPNTKMITFNGTTYKVVATHPNVTSGCSGCHSTGIPPSLP